MAPKTASQTAGDEPTPEDTRDFAPFTFEGRDVALYRPSSGQEYILLTILNLGDESATQAEQVRTVRTFGVMIGSLFLEPADLDFVLGTLARGGDIEPFVDLARQMAEHWAIADDEPANRAERRTRERQPARPVPARRSR